MINELLWFGLLFVCFGMIIFSYRFFGKYGLYTWTALAVILANIQVLKTIEVFGLVTTLGNVVYSSMFLVTDILNENHTKKDAKRAVWIGFFVLIATTIIMQLAILFEPHKSDFSHEHISSLFSFFWRIALASLVAYFVSQTHEDRKSVV